MLKINLLALNWDQRENAKILLNNSADIKIKDEGGNTMLHEGIFSLDMRERNL